MVLVNKRVKFKFKISQKPLEVLSVTILLRTSLNQLNRKFSRSFLFVLFLLLSVDESQQKCVSVRVVERR